MYTYIYIYIYICLLTGIMYNAGSDNTGSKSRVFLKLSNANMTIQTNKTWYSMILVLSIHCKIEV